MLLTSTPTPPPIIKCVDCSPAENQTLEFLQSRGIHDVNALATVMGNIKQESNFRPNVCEGGAILPYDACLIGGYGLIQWTSKGRYDGLAQFARAYGGDPSTLATQLRYMVNEPQWIRYSLVLQGRGQTVEHYMHHAYEWLGWGIHGNRTTYAYDYTKKLIKFTPPPDANDTLPNQIPPSTHSQSQGDIRIPFGVC